MDELVGNVGIRVNKKLNQILKKKKNGFCVMVKVLNIYNEESLLMEGLRVNLNGNVLTFYKYTQIEK